MERKTMWAAISLAAALSGTSALADENGFYVGASIGRIEQSFDTDNWATYDPASGNIFPSVRADSSNDQVGWGLSLGYRLNQYLAAELSYLNTGTADRSNVFSNSVTQKLSSRISGPALSLLPSYSFATNFRAYLRAGVMVAMEHVDYNNGFAQTFADTTWLAGVGVEYTLNEHWNMNLEYLRSGGLDEPFGKDGNHLSGVTFGVKYRF